MENDEIVIERHDHTTHGEYLVSIGPGDAAGKLTWTQRGDARDAEDFPSSDFEVDIT